MLDADGRQVRVPPEDFASWLATLESSLAQELDALGRLCGLLEEGQDLPLAEIPSRVSQAARLGRLGQRLGALSRRLGLGEGEGPPPEARSQAEALLALLGVYPGGLPEPVR